MGTSTTGTGRGAFAARLRWLRDRSGLTRRAVSDLTDPPIAYSFVGKLERGDKKRLGVDIALDLAELFGARVEWLFRGEGQPPSETAILEAIDLRRHEKEANRRPRRGTAKPAKGTGRARRGTGR